MSLVFDQSSPNLKGCESDIEHNCHVAKRILTEIQDGGCRHLELRKTVTNSLLFEHSTPNLMGMLWLWCRTHASRRRIAQWSDFKTAAVAIVDFEKLLTFLDSLTNSHQIWWDVVNSMKNAFIESKNSAMIRIRDGGCHPLELRKTVAISLLFDQSSPNLEGRFRVRCKTHMSCRKRAHWPKFKMVAVANSSVKWPLTNHHQLCWDYCESDVECIWYIKNYHIIQKPRWRLLLSWISKNNCHFFAIRPILANFGGNVSNPV